MQSELWQVRVTLKSRLRSAIPFQAQLALRSMTADAKRISVIEKSLEGSMGQGGTQAAKRAPSRNG
jgi:hypothetical protein